MLHFCGALFCVIILLLLLNLIIIILLVCMTWVTSMWEECCEESGKCQGISQYLESDHPEEHCRPSLLWPPVQSTVATGLKSLLSGTAVMWSTSRWKDKWNKNWAYVTVCGVAGGMSFAILWWLYASVTCFTGIVCINNKYFLFYSRCWFPAKHPALSCHHLGHVTSLVARP